MRDIILAAEKKVAGRKRETHEKMFPGRQCMEALILNTRL
jgi:hypothetical protein